MHDGGKMQKAHKRWGLLAAPILAAGILLAIVAPTVASAAPTSAPCTISGPAVMSAGHSAHLSGIIVAAGNSCTGAGHKPPPEPPFNGQSPAALQRIKGRSQLRLPAL